MRMPNTTPATPFFMINDMTDNFIPTDQRSEFLADGSYYLALAILALARAGGIPPAEKQKAGEEAIALARQALEIHTQPHGIESAKVAGDMTVLADALNHFNNVDDDQVLRLYEQSTAITSRVEGSSSPNVAVCEGRLGNVYSSRANKALAANDLDRELANLELALTHLREAVRIYKVNNHVDSAEGNLRTVAAVEEKMRQIEIARAAAGAVTKG